MPQRKGAKRKGRRRGAGRRRTAQHATARAPNAGPSKEEPGLVERVAEVIEKLTEDRASPFNEIEHPKKRAFLCAYALLGSKQRAAEAAGISRALIYMPGWRDDPQFQDAVERARRMACDVIEDEIHRRGVEGWEEPVGWYKGELGGYVRRYSDTLLIFRAKGEMPEKYGDRLALSGGLAHLDVTQLPDDMLVRIARGEPVEAVLASALERALPAGEATPEDDSGGAG